MNRNKTHQTALAFNKMLFHFRNPRSAAIPRKLIIAKERLNYHHQEEEPKKKRKKRNCE